MRKIAVALLACIVAFGAAAMSKKVESDAAMVSGKATDFSLKTPEGKEIKLSDYKGKTVIVNFWATWCPYCVKEMPDLVALYAKYGGSDFEIIAVDLQEPSATVKEFIKKKDLKFTVVIDSTGDVAKAYGVYGIPTSVLIDKDGKVIWSVNQLPADLEKTLGEMTKPATKKEEKKK